MKPRVRKCRFCYADIQAGGQPACAEACLTGATKFGLRDDLVREAYVRLQAEPEKYVDRIYGIEEVGGTSILYLTSVPFEQLGFRTDLQKEPLPDLTWNALSKVPTVVAVGGVFLWGVWWMTNRREDVRRAEGEAARPNRGKEPDQEGK